MRFAWWPNTLLFINVLKLSTFFPLDETPHIYITPVRSTGYGADSYHQFGGQLALISFPEVPLRFPQLELRQLVFPGN